MVFQQVSQCLKVPALTELELPCIREFLRLWVLDQANWHAVNSAAKREAAHASHRAVGWMLAATLIAAVLHWLDVIHNTWIDEAIASIAIILPALASAQHAIGSIHDDDRIAARSERMAIVLKELAQSIGEAATEAALNAEAQRAETIMSTENHEWCVSLAFRRLSLPV